MESRRDFLKKAALLSGTAAMWTAVPESIQNALAVNPDPGTTYLDAEHIVILMQENRSFDHSYGTLQGVRGYNDPRAHVLANGHPVWLQTNAGKIYAPFRLDIRETNVTWTGALPHSWQDQVDAHNKGRYDRWLHVKTGRRAVASMPMTLGHYTREDIPFYYALADAFTICDQHFCSSLTGTTPNRLYLWSGKIRDRAGKARVYNEEADLDADVDWTTFPERLEDQGISWKIYQNELYVESGFAGEEEQWLSNFGDNPLEYFTQFNVRFAERHREYLANRETALPVEIEAIEEMLRTRVMPEADAAKAHKELEAKKAEQKRIAAEKTKWTQENWNKLSARERSLHAKAFCDNSGDPLYRRLATLKYTDGGQERTVQVPAGDVFHQFRQDVQTNKLPTVSWLVAPQSFSDHPGSAWYGAWYVSEALDILTRNPEVWKKTIFILTYDENDGYFDHVVPFTAPNPRDPTTGRVSEGIDAATEYVSLEEDRKSRPAYSPRDNSIGLGYRVPLVVASPWSRGGCVCSQVFDHTSILQFLEHFLTRKTGRRVLEPNISTWRRTVCGDLTSIFQPYQGEPIAALRPTPRDAFIEGIHRARFKKTPNGAEPLTPEDIETIQRDPEKSPQMPAQERGTRPSAPLPYQLYADGGLNAAKSRFELRLQAKSDVFGKQSAGSPFHVYAYTSPGDLRMRAYAVGAGKKVDDSWLLADFEGGRYSIRVDGPNGFMREFKGNASDSRCDAIVEYGKSNSRKLNGNIEVRLSNHDSSSVTVELRPHAYGQSLQRRTIAAGEKATFVIETAASHGWYDFTVAAGACERRCAGRVETGDWSMTDPVMGRVET